MPANSVLTLPLCLALAAQCVFPQATGKNIHNYTFSAAATPAEIAELAKLVRQQLTFTATVEFDAGTRTLSFGGDHGQLAVADWLLQELDPPSTRLLRDSRTVVREFEVLGAPRNVILLGSTSWARTPLDFLELESLLRNIATVEWVRTYKPAGIVVVYGTRPSLDFGAWLLRQIESPTDERYYNFAGRSGRNEDVVARVLRTNARDRRDLEQLYLRMQNDLGIHRAWFFEPSRLMVVRGTSEQIARAEELASAH